MVQLDDFEPKVLDAPEEPIEGRLIGLPGSQFGHIAHHGDVQGAEGCSYRRARHASNGQDEVAATHSPMIDHACMRMLNRVSCRHPVRVHRLRLEKSAARSVWRPSVD